MLVFFYDYFMSFRRGCVDCQIYRDALPQALLLFGMFFDFNFPVPNPGNLVQRVNLSKRSQEKQPQHSGAAYSPTQINDIETRLDLLIHCQSSPFPLLPVF